MKHLGCMISGNTVSIEPGTKGENTDAIIVMRRGEIIGVVSPRAQEEVQSLRMTFTRDSPKERFVPLQGVAVQNFTPASVDDSI
jgi:hypothetical protein